MEDESVESKVRKTCYFSRGMLLHNPDYVHASSNITLLAKAFDEIDPEGRKSLELMRRSYEE